VSYDAGPYPPVSLVTADFNNDGQLDLAVGNITAYLGSKNVSVRLGRGDGTFGEPILSPVGGDSPHGLTVADFDDDGNLDLAMLVVLDEIRYVDGAGYWVDNAVNVLWGQGDGSFQAPSVVDLNDPYYVLKPQSLAVGDLNGDGTMDLALASAYDGYYPNDVYADFGQVSVLLSNGDRTFDEPKRVVSLSSDIDLSIVVADFNGDGHEDVAAGTVEGSVVNGVGVNLEGVRVTLGDGTGNFANADGFALWVMEHGTSMVAGDLNGDGDVDLVAADDVDVNVRLGNGVGGFEPPRGGHSYAAGEGPSSAVLGDFDRDGVIDIATANFNSSDISILRGRGDGAFLPAVHFTIPPTAIADFDGSGVIDSGDLATWRSDFGSSAGSDADGDGDSDGFDFLAWQRQLGSTAEEVANVGPHSIVAGDFNGDGWLDIATSNQRGKSVSILLNDQTWEPLSAAVTVSIDNVSQQEGTSATTTPFTFTVTLSAAADQPVTMSYRTVYGSALDWPNTPWPDQNDYVAKTGTLSFAPGKTTKTITIDVKADNYIERDEIFYVDLFDSSSNSVFTTSYGIGTILNDDVPIPLFVYDIRFESRRGGKDWRAVFEVRRDSNADGIGTSSDAVAAGVQINVAFAGQTYTGATDANGVFRTDWRIDLGNGNYYANAVDLALTGFSWDPLALDLENDSDGDGLPDALLSVG